MHCGAATSNERADGATEIQHTIMLGSGTSIERADLSDYDPTQSYPSQDQGLKKVHGTSADVASDTGACLPTSCLRTSRQAMPRRRHATAALVPAPCVAGWRRHALQGAWMARLAPRRHLHASHSGCGGTPYPVGDDAAPRLACQCHAGWRRNALPNSARLARRRGHEYRAS